jgi:hypothetical protein
VQALNLGESEASEELPALGAQISAEVRNSESLGIYFIIYIYIYYGKIKFTKINIDLHRLNMR